MTWRDVVARLLHITWTAACLAVGWHLADVVMGK